MALRGAFDTGSALGAPHGSVSFLYIRVYLPRQLNSLFLVSLVLISMAGGGLSCHGYACGAWRLACARLSVRFMAGIDRVAVLVWFLSVLGFVCLYSKNF